MQLCFSAGHRSVCQRGRLLRSAAARLPVIRQRSILTDFREEIYWTDLHSKRIAFAMAGLLHLRGRTLSINLLPMTLVNVPNAVEFLLAEVKPAVLIPEQIIVEFTESEAISVLMNSPIPCVSSSLREFAWLSIIWRRVCRAVAVGSVSAGSHQD